MNIQFVKAQDHQLQLYMYIKEIQQDSIHLIHILLKHVVILVFVMDLVTHTKIMLLTYQTQQDYHFVKINQYDSNNNTYASRIRYRSF